MTLGISLLQFLLKHSNHGRYCARSPDGELASEGKALTLMISLQVVKVVAFAVWAVWRSSESIPQKERASDLIRHDAVVES